MGMTYEEFKEKILPAIYAELAINADCKNKPPIGKLCCKCNSCGRFTDNPSGLDERTKIKIYEIFINEGMDK